VRDAFDDPAVRRNVGLLATVGDAVRIMSRALTAAHYYDTLKAASDQALRAAGLTRGDVPRAVYRRLTGQR
jgi:hypothetical protein